MIKFTCSMLIFVIVPRIMIKLNRNRKSIANESLTMLTGKKGVKLCVCVCCNKIKLRASQSAVTETVSLSFWCVCGKKWRSIAIEYSSLLELFFCCLLKLFSFRSPSYSSFFSLYAAMYTEWWLLFNMKCYLAMRITYLSKRMKAIYWI